MIGMLHNKQKQPETHFQLQFHPDSHSLTQRYSPIFRRPAQIQSSFLQPSPQPSNNINQQVKQQYHQVMKTVDDISMFISNRMQVHQQQLLSIMRKQLSSMMELVDKTINKYQKKMLQNNIDEEIEQLKAEIEYFKFEALTLLEEKKALEKEVRALKQRIRQFTEREGTNNIVLQKIKAKLMKEKQKNSGKSKSLSTLELYTAQTKGYKSSKDKNTTPSRHHQTFLTNFDLRINACEGIDKMRAGPKKCKTQLNQQEDTKSRQSENIEKEFLDIGSTIPSTIPQIKTANAFHANFHITRKNIKRDRNMRKENAKIQFK